VNGDPRRLADISRAKKLLGFEPSISLEEGLRGLVDRWRKMRAIPEGKKLFEDGKNFGKNRKQIPLLRILIPQGLCGIRNIR